MRRIDFEVEVKKYKNEIIEQIREKKDEYRICDDNYIGTVSFDREKSVWRYDKKYILKEERNEKNIKIDNKTNSRLVIVLESPHIEEYSTKKPMPAVGETGKALNEHLIDILNKKFTNYEKSIDGKEGKFDIILMNAIQYQTSLGCVTEMFRDRIWLKVWIELGGREEFIERLKSYDPNIIMNLCTKGSHKFDLIYRSNKISYMTSIRQSYIKQLNISDVCIDDEGKILKDKKVISKPDYIAKNNNKEAFKYTLSKFVDNAIEEIENVNEIRGPHPASWNRLKNLNKNFFGLFDWI